MRILMKTKNTPVTITRSRNSNGQIRQKRWDTIVWTIEKKYNVNLEVRSDMKISNYLEKKWFSSLSKIIKNK